MFKFKRFKKRLRLEFTDGKAASKGFTTEIAEDSMYISCRKPLKRGDWLEIVAYLPDDKSGRAKAKVLMSEKAVAGVGDSGMEVELTLYNKAFASFLASLVGELKGNDLSLLVKPGDFPGDVEEQEPEPRPDIVVPEEKEPEPEPEPKPEPKPEKEESFIIMECGFCGTKNKVPEDRILDGPVCGMCKESLLKTS